MAFSGALTLTDLNDYLGPSQACIKPVSGKDAPSAEQKETGTASTEIAIDADGEYYESTLAHAKNADGLIDNGKPRARTRLETAEISLNDCLACSGCVTSAESVLIGMQSVDELRKAVAKKGTKEGDAPDRIVVSISPQSLASLSAKYSSSLADPLSLRAILDRVEFFLKSKMHVDTVIDTSFARHISLSEQAKEFRQRKEESLSSTEPTLPMLASACPGWICYAEKTHGELIPLISKTRSPQQIAGILAKRYLAEVGLENPAGRVGRVYHTTVMPCYDKKLEASREDFFDDITQSRDVDLVITTGELDDLMQAENFNLASPIQIVHNDVSMTTPPDSLQEALHYPGIPSLLQQPGSSSGSYLFDLIRRVWADSVEEAQVSHSATQIPRLSVKMIRSADYTEYVLYAQDESGKILFKGAQCYGFRNLQNLVRKVQRQTGLKSKKAAAGSLLDGPSTLNTERRSANAFRGRGRGGMVRRGRGGLAGRSSTNGSSPLARSDADQDIVEDEESRAYDFVEVMACPGGCVNGGGQIRPPGQINGSAGSSALTSRSITADVTEAVLDDTSANKSNTGEKALDPEGYISGWSTPPLSISGTSEGTAGIEIEGPRTQMDLDETNEPAVQGWKGTSKEWVKRVEYLYWRALRENSEDRMIGNIHQAQALGISRDQIDGQISKTLQKASANLAASVSLDILAERIIQFICKGQKRTDILRTQYRALQDEAVSGLAVQW